MLNKMSNGFGTVSLDRTPMIENSAHSIGKNLQIVLKVAEHCNIACTYCYFFFSTDQSYKTHPPIIPLDKVDDVIDFLRRVLTAEKHDALSIILHGGEPLLAPHETLERIVVGANVFKHEGLVVNVSIVMQTNGLLLSEKNISFLEKHKIGAGVSVDGDKINHDMYRIDHKNRGTYDRTIAGYKRLAARTVAAEGASPGILSVANPLADGGATLKHFVEDLGCRALNFLTPDYTYDDDIVDEAYTDGVEAFMIAVFREWVNQKNPKIRVRFIDEIIDPLFRDGSAMRCVQTKLDYFRLLTISSDGTVAPEDTVKLIGPRFQNIGNVNDFDAMDQIYKDSVFSELEASITNPPTQCAECDWFGICAGEKTISRYSSANGLNNPNIYCKALKSIRLEVAAWMVECGVPVEDIERRLELAKAQGLNLAAVSHIDTSAVHENQQRLEIS